jgi:hypothetical protein
MILYAEGFERIGRRHCGTGLSNPDILSHCRGPGPHVRGCWVVDLVLAKE